MLLIFASANRTLIRNFFEQAVSLMAEDGEIHLTKKSGGAYELLNIEKLALECGLKLKQKITFPTQDYPFKWGISKRADTSFNFYGAKTYVFVKM